MACLKLSAQLRSLKIVNYSQLEVTSVTGQFSRLNIDLLFVRRYLAHEQNETFSF